MPATALLDDPDIRAEWLARRRRAAIAGANIPERYAEASLDATEHATAVRNWLQGARSAAGCLVVLGPVGTGKTYLAAALVLDAPRHGISARYDTAGAYLRRVRESWDTREISEASVFAAMLMHRVLVLDDIGAHRGGENDAWRVHELIAERYERELPTVLVSNLRPQDLRAEIGERAYDRIRERYTQINLLGESRRKGG
jgi:DNA replication protein DnaC